MRFLSIIACVCTLPAFVLGQHVPTRAAEIQRHNMNQVELCISNFGKFGQNEQGEPGCWWPIGTNSTYIYGAGLWFGAIASVTGDTLVSTGYDFLCVTNYAPGLHDMLPGNPDAVIYMYPYMWPPPDSTYPMAPQDTISHQDSWCSFHDCDSIMHDSRPIGIEVYQTGSVWDEPFIEDVVYLTYEIRNVSGHTLHDCHIGIAVDSRNCVVDSNTCIIERTYQVDGEEYLVDNIGYSYDAQYGAIGFDLLQTPFDLQEGHDKDNDGIPDQYERDSVYYWQHVPQWQWDVDNDGVPDWRDASENPQLEMTAYKQITPTFFPANDRERYSVLAGYDFNLGQFIPYDTIPGDRPVFVSSSGPFEMAADSSIAVVLAIVLAEYGPGATPQAETCLVISDYWAQEFYNMNWSLQVEEHEPVTAREKLFTITPHPVSGMTVISFCLPEPDIVSLELYSAAGRLVRVITDSNYPAGTHAVPLSTYDLSQGTYFVMMKTKRGEYARPVTVVR